MSQKHNKFTVEHGSTAAPSDWFIRYDPIERKVHENGSISFGMSFPILVATEYVGNPEEVMQSVARTLNDAGSKDELISSLVSTLEALKPVAEREISRVLINDPSDQAWLKLKQIASNADILFAKAQQLGALESSESDPKNG